MLDKKIEDMIVEQMNFEIHSAYIYLAMGAYCDSIDMPGFANWFKIQWEEEIYHSTRMYEYIVERGGRPILESIEAPQKEWSSLIDTFEKALIHEQEVTKRINSIMTEAVNLSDHATRSFFNWYIDEQVEEEATVDTIIKQLKMVKDSGHGLFMMDKEMGSRAFVKPTK